MIVTSVNLSVWGWIMSLVWYVWMNFISGFDWGTLQLPLRLSHPVEIITTCISTFTFTSNMYSNIFRLGKFNSFLLSTYNKFGRECGNECEFSLTPPNETDMKQVAVGVEVFPKHPIMKKIQTDEK